MSIKFDLYVGKRKVRYYEIAGVGKYVVGSNRDCSIRLASKYVNMHLPPKLFTINIDRKMRISTYLSLETDIEDNQCQKQAFNINYFFPVMIDNKALTETEVNLSLDDEIIFGE